MEKRIMFCGASGTGKTTLAKHISEKYSIPFVSGSMSDLFPETKDIPHVDMLKMYNEKSKIFYDEQKYLSKRYKNLKQLKGEFVTDRSFIDNLAYAIYKTSDEVDACDFDSMIETIKTCILDLRISHIIFIPVTPEMLENEEYPEDNGKRITNQYFQFVVSQIMLGCFMLLEDWVKTNGISMFALWDMSIEERKEDIDRFILS